MTQKGDDLINGVNHNYQYPYTSNNRQIANRADEFVGCNSGNLIQAMSFEDYVPPLESTLPSVETVLPQFIPTPPPSLPSPSVNITSTVNTTVPQFQFQLQHQTPAPPPSVQLQHNQNINNHHYYCDQQQQTQLQHQQVGFHSLSPFQLNHTSNNNKNIESTFNTQLVVDRDYILFKVLF